MASQNVTDRSPTSLDWRRLQAQWDVQQEGYMPDREERFTAMLDVVEAWCGPSPRILDLAAGTGSITRRALQRWPAATSVLVDADPALLAIAAATFAEDVRVTVRPANLASPEWLGQSGLSGGRPFDAVLTATALHWLTPDRVQALYAEAAGLLGTPGLVANADHIPDDGLGLVTDRLDDVARGRGRVQRERTAALDWDDWWAQLRAIPDLAPLVAERDRLFAHRSGTNHTESDQPVAWHVAALRQAGLPYTGLIWRGLNDAVVVGAR
jgi:SAM-dependent methyltransferase